MDYVVELEHVTASYQDLVALEDVTFRVAAGEFDDAEGGIVYAPPLERHQFATTRGMKCCAS